MKLKFVGGPYNGRTFDLEPDGVIIGRAPENDVTIDDDEVSRQHCRIFVKKGEWTIEDLDSTNGVHVNGIRIEEPCSLKNGDRIGIHQYVLVYGDEATVAAAGAAGAEKGGGGVEASAAAAAGGGGFKTLGAHSEEKEEPEKGEGIPMGRVIALTVVIAGIVVLAVLTFSSGGETGQDQQESQAGEDAGDGGTSAEQKVGTGKKTENTGQETEGETEDGGQNIFTPSGGREGEPDEEETAEEAGQEEQPGGTPRHEEPDPEKTFRKLAYTEPVTINSRPPGAAVKLDGTKLGKTPITLPLMRKREYRVQIEKPGFESKTRVFTLPDNPPSEPYELGLAAGALHLDSKPSGATVLAGSKVLGETPLVNEDLPPGEHRLRIVKLGYKSKKIKVKVSDVEGARKTVDLSSQMASLALVTRPPGCEVSIDRALQGETAKDPESKNRQSKLLTIDRIMPGKHRLKIEHPLGFVKSSVIKLKPGQHRRLKPILFWVKDTALHLEDGSNVRGMLINKNEAGDILLALAPSKMKRFYNAQITKVVDLSAEKARLMAGGKGLDTSSQTRLADLNVKKKVFTPEELKAIFGKHKPKAINRVFTGKTCRIKGKPATVSEAGRPFMKFGERIRCDFKEAYYEQHKTRVQQATQLDRKLAVKGHVVGYNNGMLLLHGCRFIEDAEGAE